MRSLLVSILLACFTMGCQSNASKIPLFEVRYDKPLSVRLKTRDKADLQTWESCHTRRVWFDVKDAHGRRIPPLGLVDVFWSANSSDLPGRDATEFKVRLDKVAHSFVIGKGEPMLFGQWIDKAGTYLLEFHVDCYDRNHHLLYSSAEEKIRCHISDPTLLDKRSKTEVSEVTLWLSREK